MKFSRLFLTLSLWFLNSATLAKIADETEIKVIVASRIEAPAHRDITLDDVAAISGIGVDQGETIGSAVLFPPLKAQETRILNGAEIARLVKEKIALPAGAQLRMIVPESVEIRAGLNALNLAGVEHGILRAAQRWCEDCRITVRDLKLPTGAVASEGRIWEVDYGRVTRGGAVLVPVKAAGANETYWITGALKTEQLGYIVTRALPVGSSIPEASIEERWIETTHARDALASREEVLSQVTQRFLSLGTAIQKSDLKKVYAVKKGQTVKAVSRTEFLEVSRQMVADENGYIGEMIRLKNPETQKFISGKVLDEQSARIE